MKFKDLDKCIEKTLCVASKHITPEDVEKLNRWAELSVEDCPYPSNGETDILIVYDLYYGWLIYVPSDQEELNETLNYADISDNLSFLMKLSFDNDCCYLHLDADGIELGELETFDW